MKRGLFVLGAALLLSSCIGITTSIELDANGSGEITLSYDVSRMVLNLGSLDEAQPFYAIPIERDDFEDIADRVDGLRVRSYGMDEDASDVHIDVTLAFDDIDALSALFGAAGGDTVALSTSGGRTTYRQIVFGGYPEGIDRDSLGMIEALFSDYKLQFSLTAPAQIVSVSHGSMSGRRATIEHSIPEIVAMTEALVWEITW